MPLSICCVPDHRLAERCSLGSYNDSRELCPFPEFPLLSICTAQGLSQHQYMCDDVSDPDLCGRTNYPSPPSTSRAQAWPSERSAQTRGILIFSHTHSFQGYLLEDLRRIFELSEESLRGSEQNISEHGVWPRCQAPPGLATKTLDQRRSDM